jgi:hypothetical protein
MVSIEGNNAVGFLLMGDGSSAILKGGNWDCKWAWFLKIKLLKSAFFHQHLS